MNNKKAIIAVALTLGLSLSLIPSCESKSASQTGALESESQSILSSSEEFLASLDSVEVQNVTSVLMYPEEHTIKECQKAAYEYLIANNLSPEDIKDILETIIVYGNHPMGLDEAEYVEILGVLAEKLPVNINAFTAFYPFALAYHESYCDLKHHDNTCDALDALWHEMGPVDLEAILDLKLKDDPVYKRLKLASLILSGDMGSYINELLDLSSVSLSTPMSEESLRMCFPFLAETLGQNEKLLDTYYLLSQRVLSIFERGEIDIDEDNLSLI